METKTEKFQEFAIVEMMGHRKIAARVTEPEFGGSQLLRCDVFNGEGEIERTEYIGVGSIYCLTVVTEEVAIATAKNYAPRPSFAFGLPKQLVSAIDADYEENSDFGEYDDEG